MKNKKCILIALIVLILVISFGAIIYKNDNTLKYYPLDRRQFYHLQNTYKVDNKVIVMLPGPIVLDYQMDEVKPNASKEKTQKALHIEELPEMDLGKEYLYVVYKYSFGKFQQEYLVKVILFEKGGNYYLKKISSSNREDWILSSEVIHEYAWATWLDCRHYRIKTLEDGTVQCEK